MSTNNIPHPTHRAEWLPTLTQELLLKAVLADGSKAFELWNQWKSRIELDNADAGSQRLLPHLYRKLKEQGSADPDLEKYKGVYRFFWYKNQMLFNVGTDMLAKFHERGIKTMILKGADLATRYYKDIGLRPMNDIDILVETERAQEALEIIQRAGFVPDERIRLRYTPAIIPLLHGFAFVNSRNHGIDLHWHVLPEACQP
ncbi:MAG TPA: nucleotidyltransferase family protein, partial [Bacteroidota bacterium]